MTWLWQMRRVMLYAMYLIVPAVTSGQVPHPRLDPRRRANLFPHPQTESLHLPITANSVKPLLAPSQSPAPHGAGFDHSGY